VPRLMRLRMLLAALPLVVLAGCNSSSGQPTPQLTGPVYGPESPAATAVGAELPADQQVTVTGSFGEKPTVTFPSGQAPTGLHRTTLVEGTGAELKSGQVLVANYYGIVWGASTPFDNSYDKKAAASFVIGAGQVVKGWDVGLPGVKEGSRVVLVLGPSEGYGLNGNTAVNIKGTDTLVFVIDVLKVLEVDQFGQPDAAAQPAPANSPVVGGAPGTAPTVTFPEGLAEPTEVKLDVLYKGTGPTITLGTVLAQYVVYQWGETQATESTWQESGPIAINLTSSIAELQGLVGVPIGSRVLLQLTKDDTTGRSAGALVLDLLYQPPTPS
jgi:peptidylprolyl isomerase